MIDASVLRARIRERMDEHVSGPVLMDDDAIRHGEDDEILALIDEIEMDRIDDAAKAWARLREAGYEENELRALAGDR